MASRERHKQEESSTAILHPAASRHERDVQEVSHSHTACFLLSLYRHARSLSPLIAADCVAVVCVRVRFTPSESISGQSQAKSSVQRNLRKAILETLPGLEPHMDELLPKKLPVYVAKCQSPSHTNLILVNKEPLFIQLRDQHYLPTLRLLHRFPDIMPKVRVDRGAIKFVLKGADVMCPGLTSAGGRLGDVELPTETAVAIQAEGKEHAVAIGITKMSTRDMSAYIPYTHARHVSAVPAYLCSWQCRSVGLRCAHCGVMLLAVLRLCAVLC